MGLTNVSAGGNFNDAALIWQVLKLIKVIDKRKLTNVFSSYEDTSCVVKKSSCNCK